MRVTGHNSTNWAPPAVPHYLPYDGPAVPRGTPRPHGRENPDYRRARLLRDRYARYLAAKALMADVRSRTKPHGDSSRFSTFKRTHHKPRPLTPEQRAEVNRRWAIYIERWRERNPGRTPTQPQLAMLKAVATSRVTWWLTGLQDRQTERRRKAITLIRRWESEFHSDQTMAVAAGAPPPAPRQGSRGRISLEGV